MILWQFIGNQLSGREGFPLRLLSWWHNSWDGIIKCKMYTVCKIRNSLTSCTAAQENTQKQSVYLHFSLGQTLEQYTILAGFMAHLSEPNRRKMPWWLCWSTLSSCTKVFLNRVHLMQVIERLRGQFRGLGRGKKTQKHFSVLDSN